MKNGICAALILVVMWMSMSSVDAKSMPHRKRHRNKGRHLISFEQLKSDSDNKVPSPVLKEMRHSPPIRGSRKAFVVTKKSYLKKEWCKTQVFKQVVREPGCISRTIMNRFCYGQCNSFYIPKSDKRDIKEAAFLSCGFCKPRKYSNIHVTLLCPGKGPFRLKRKRVLMIKKCRCMAQKVDIS